MASKERGEAVSAGLILFLPRYSTLRFLDRGTREGEGVGGVYTYARAA